MIYKKQKQKPLSSECRKIGRWRGQRDIWKIENSEMADLHPTMSIITLD